MTRLSQIFDISQPVTVMISTIHFVITTFYSLYNSCLSYSKALKISSYYLTVINCVALLLITNEYQV